MRILPRAHLSMRCDIQAVNGPAGPMVTNVEDIRYAFTRLVACAWFSQPALPPEQVDHPDHDEKR
jgi:hypothetical protein